MALVDGVRCSHAQYSSAVKTLGEEGSRPEKIVHNIHFVNRLLRKSFIEAFYGTNHWDELKASAMCTNSPLAFSIISDGMTS